MERRHGDHQQLLPLRQKTEGSARGVGGLPAPRSHAATARRSVLRKARPAPSAQPARGAACVKMANRTSRLNHAELIYVM
jgi:hypothetical protein